MTLYHDQCIMTLYPIFLKCKPFTHFRYLCELPPLILSYIAGMAYNMEEPERSATMSRIETKKMKEKKNNSYLSALPASSEELLEGVYVCVRNYM